MNEIGRGHFPEEKRVVVEWTAGATETPISINVGPLSAKLPPNTPTIAPENIAQVISEGYNVTVSATPDDYEAPKVSIEESATQPGGASNGPGSAKVLDGPGGAPATITSVDPDMRGGSINGGAEGQQREQTEYPATAGTTFGASTDASEGEGEGETESDESEETAAGPDEETLTQAQALQGLSVAKLEEALTEQQDLAVLEAALAAEKGAGPDKERSTAVNALQKAIEQHPDNKAS